MIIDAVILAYTLDEEVFQMNLEAIHSLRNSEPEIDFQIVLVESNPDWPGQDRGYGPGVEVLLPGEAFNFNRFNRLGAARGTAPWVLFANNDVVFHPGWASAMLDAHRLAPALRCLCPVDPASQHTPPGTFPESAAFCPGYKVRVHFTGWCFLLQRSVFEITGPFDERFDYYFADDDFSMTLRKHSILNAAVPAARVSHLAHVTSRKASLDVSAKFKQDQQTFHRKWGPQRLIAWKDRLVKYVLRPLGWKRFIRKIYRSN